MSEFFRFELVWVVYLLLPLVFFAAVAVWRWSREVIFLYPLAQVIKLGGGATAHPRAFIFYTGRLITLILLSLLSAKPQLVDYHSQIDVDGIDIMLVLDVSGSMQFQDYADDRRSRFDIAKAEAIRFIKKRNNDSIGLVIFGNGAVSRCPITLDKRILQEIIHELNLGDINADGTLLATGMVTAANRLKHAKGKSKVMILLTDGEPSPGDLDDNIAIEVAQKLGIKVHVIGIGSDRPEQFLDPYLGLILKPKINRQLLEKIAHKTGGKFFIARNTDDMRSIYDTIDQLEKDERQAPVFTRYHDIFTPLAVCIFAWLLFELWLSSCIWFGL